jgi:hypothetical protein
MRAQQRVQNFGMQVMVMSLYVSVSRFVRANAPLECLVGKRLEFGPKSQN